MASIAELQSLANARVGDLVSVFGYYTDGDGGGGLFKLIQVNDFVSNASVAPSAAVAVRQLTTNWKYGIEREQPIYNHVGDRIQWTGGAVWTKNEQWAGPSETSAGSRGWAGDASLPVANGERGYLIPKVQGFRVVPTYAGYNRTTIWERVVEGGEVTPEMFGAKLSDRPGVIGQGNDCSKAIQAALDSPFAVRFNGGSYYVDEPLFLKYAKTVTGEGGGAHAFDATRAPDGFTDTAVTRLWTNQNINILNIQAWCRIDGIQFNVQHTPNGAYDSTILNYDLSFQNWGSSVENCAFYGNRITCSQHAGKGGVAIRFNNDDADNTRARRDSSFQGGWVCGWRSRSIYIEWMAIGHLIDSRRTNETSPETGLPINTFVNCTDLDATYYGVKQAVRWNDGSINRITGDYCQDAQCLPYAERDMPMFYLRAPSTEVDIGIGDQRFTLPAVNDDVALGGSVVYPQPHYAPYNYDVDGGVSFSGRALRDYNFGYTLAKANPRFSIENAALVSLDSCRGHFFSKKDFSRPTLTTSWIDNQLLFADLKSTVVVSSLRASPGFDFLAATDELAGQVGAATGVTASNFAGLWTQVGVPIPAITFGAGSVASTDFVELTLKNPVEPVNFIQRSAELLLMLKIGCQKVQVIARTSGAVVTNHLIDVSTHAGQVKTFRIPIDANNSKTKLIIRFIGSVGVDTEIQSMHLNTFTMTAYPFLPVGGGTLYGPLTVPSLAFSSGSGLSPLPRRTIVNLSSADLLSGNSGGIRSVVAGQWMNIIAAYFEVTGGTLDYATNTNLEFFQGSRFFPFFSVNLGALPSNGRRVMLPISASNVQYGAEGMSWQVQTGNPTAGNKSLRLVIDYMTGQQTS